MGKERMMSADPIFAAKLHGYKPGRSVYWPNWNACTECDYLFRNCNLYGQCPNCGSYDTYKPFAATVNWPEIDRRRAEYKAERGNVVNLDRYRAARNKTKAKTKTSAALG